MTTLIDWIARALLDEKNRSLTPQQLEALWQQTSSSPELQQEAVDWLNKLRETSPDAAELVEENWVDPNIE